MRLRPRLLNNTEIHSMSESEILEELFIERTYFGFYIVGMLYALTIMILRFIEATLTPDAAAVALTVVVILGLFFIVFLRQYLKLKSRVIGVFEKKTGPEHLK